MGLFDVHELGGSNGRVGPKTGTYLIKLTGNIIISK